MTLENLPSDPWHTPGARPFLTSFAPECRPWAAFAIVLTNLFIFTYLFFIEI